MHRNKGFTLVELLITIVVLTILLALSVPAMQEFIKNNRIATQTNRLILAVQVARSEAVKRGTGAVVCAANTSMDGCSADTDWTTGWIVFTDRDQDKDLTEVETCTSAADFDTKDCILRTEGPLTKSTLTGDADSLQFLPTGLAASGMSFTLTADDCNYQQRRNITITPQGHPVATEQNCS
ncbi:MAG: GspH/FimT family pseudopilin [Gammaproteobacteria bacterium]|jgi:type IV fimbrial biogenesis protein FimT